MEVKYFPLTFLFLMQPYSNSLPNTLLASNAQPLRESELAYSPFPISQSMASKYGNSVSSLGGPTASMAEVICDPFSPLFFLLCGNY